MNNSHKKNLSLLLAISNSTWTDNSMRDCEVISHTPLSNGSTKSKKNDHDTHSHTATLTLWSKWYLLAPSGEELHCMGDSKQHSRAYHQEEQQFQNVNPMRGLQVQRLPKRHNSHRPWMEQYFTPRTDSKVSFYSEHWVLVARGFHPAGSAGRWSQWTHFVLQAKDHIHSPPGMDTAWVS